MSPLPPRAARLDALSRGVFDVLVVGGGITGAAAARDAASRGLSVALVEKEDWASGTSWRSSKLVHGGLRYLRSGEIGLVFESLAERARLLRLAPHLVAPLEFLFAILAGRWVSPPKLSAGLTLYDILSLGRGARRHRRLSRAEAMAEEPLLAGADLAGAAVYSDAAADDARLTLENVLDAARLGAVVASRTAVERKLRDSSETVSGAAVRDTETGRAFDVRARVTVDATGPWSDTNRRREDPEARPRLRLSKGAHVTVASARLPVRRAVAIPVEKGRLFFVIPSGPVTLLGTTDTDYSGSVDDVFSSAEEVSYILGRAAEAFPGVQLSGNDLVATFAGIRALRFEEGRDVAATSREETIQSSGACVSVTGGKLTTHRRMGERAIDAAARILREQGVAAGPSATEARPLPGAPQEPFDAFVERFVREAAPSGASEGIARHIARRYGARAPEVLALAGGEPSTLRPLVAGLPDCEAEILFGAREEDARSASDVLIRRTHLFWQAVGQGVDALPRVQEILARELAWSPLDAARSRDGYLREVEKSRGSVEELLRSTANA